MKPASFVPPVELVAGAAIILKSQGNYYPHFKEIAIEIDRIYSENPLNGEIQASLGMSSLEVTTKFLHKVPHYLVERDILACPINGIFYTQQCPQVKSLDHARTFLTNSSHKIAGIYFPKEEDDFVYVAYHYREYGKADRKQEKFDNRIIQGIEAEIFSEKQAYEFLAKAGTTSSGRLANFQENIQRITKQANKQAKLKAG